MGFKAKVKERAKLPEFTRKVLMKKSNSKQAFKIVSMNMYMACYKHMAKKVFNSKYILESAFNRTFITHFTKALWLTKG